MTFLKKLGGFVGCVAKTQLRQKVVINFISVGGQALVEVRSNYHTYALKSLSWT